ncbi:hypothetical protein IQ07DRAFT_666287, partial [Pyrenochaeta sp. DS3sAY3a]
MLRVDVRIGSGNKIAVPITDATTFGELQEQAIARAKKMNVRIPQGDMVLRLENGDGPLAFPEDTVTDILDVSDRPEIFLCSASLAESESDQIYIRWVTPARALDMPTLSAIPIDPTAIPKNTTISDLKGIAREHLYQPLTTNEAALKADFQIELFLLQCALRTTDASETSLADLECTGSLSEPLNIFVVPMSRAFANEDKPQDLWAFDSSERGIATFITCLRVLVDECKSTGSTHRRFLKTLFNLTHFPPALEALQSLKEENKLRPFAVAILATCFRELALRIVPPEMIRKELKSVLQGSRQLFAWL